MNSRRWPSVALGDVLAPMDRGERVDDDREYRLLGVRLYAGGCYEQEVVRGSRLKTKRLFRVEPGDVVYNKMWAAKSAFAIVGVDRGSFHATSEYPTFEIDRARLVPEYLGVVFAAGELARQAAAKCKGSTSRARLHPDDFLRLTVPLPPRVEQGRISAGLGTLTDVSTHSQRVLRAAEQVRAALLSQVLAQDEDGACQIAPRRKDWAPRTVGELCDFSGGHGFTPRDWGETGLPIIRIQNLNGSREFHHFAGEPDARWIIEPGDLLFAWAGSRGSSFGPCVWSGPRGVLNQHIHKLTPRDDVDKEFLYYLLRAFTGRVEQRAHGFKDSLVHLRKAELTELPVRVPSLAIQQELASKLRTVDDRLAAERAYVEAVTRFSNSMARTVLQYV